MIVTVVWATPEVQDTVVVRVPPNATVEDAVARSCLVARYGLERTAIGYAIFGRRARHDTPLADGDRVELTRPLLVDPKAARARQARRVPTPPGSSPAARRSARREGADDD